jgi:nucleotide-binding universal stress UspA family protein
MTPPASGQFTEQPRELRIVVGVDGSDCGARALDFAANEAQLRGALLHVVSAYEDVPYTAAWPVVPLGLDQAAAGTIVDESIARVHEIDPAIVTKGEMRYGLAGRVLVDACRDATLLVVGTRGRNELLSLLLGSVSEYCVHHAEPTVTVVR